MNRLLLPLLLLLSLCTGVRAQTFSGGFRAGLNFNSLDGPAEMSADGSQAYEQYQRTTGFHVGATFALGFTDLFGIKADLMYSQKGGDFEYNEVPSYFYLYDGPDDRVGDIVFGTLNGDADVVNSYIDIPVTAYYKFGKFEIEGGASASFLVGSRQSGGLTYSNTTPNYNGADVTFNIEGNFLSDDPGGAGVIEVAQTELPGTPIFPPSVISAYYNSDNDRNLYRRLDFTLVAGLSYYLNNGLYVGARYQYGLTDVTRGENDLRIANQERTPERRFNTDDKDYTRSIQASVGFRF